LKHASKILAFGDFKNHRTPVRFSSTGTKRNRKLTGRWRLHRWKICPKRKKVHWSRSRSC